MADLEFAFSTPARHGKSIRRQKSSGATYNEFLSPENVISVLGTSSFSAAPEHFRKAVNSFVWQWSDRHSQHGPLPNDFIVVNDPLALADPFLPPFINEIVVFNESVKSLKDLFWSHIGGGEQRVPAQATVELDKEISRAQAIVEVRPDSDSGIEETYSQATFDRAVALLRHIAEKFCTPTSSAFPVPSIGAADRGSIDLFWEYAEGSLLINTSADAASGATFYGRRSNGSKISGTVVIGDIEMGMVLAAWLAGV